MYIPRHVKRKLRSALSRTLIIGFSVLGGYSGSNLYTAHAATKEQKVIADNEREHIQATTQELMETYSTPPADTDNSSSTNILMEKDDTTAIAEKTANLVSTKLINNSISGLATKKEVADLETKITNMFDSYELSDSQKEDLSKSVAAIIELDLNNLHKDPNAQTALSDAAYKNIKDLHAKATYLQDQINDINTKMSSLTTDTSKIQEAIDSSLDGYTPSGQTSTLQSKVDKLSTQYEDILSKYNKQTEKLQGLIKDNSNSDASETIKEQITTLKSTLSKLQESATSEISALENRIKEIEVTPNTTLINELKSKISDQQEQISTYKSNVQSLNRAITDLNTQLSALSDNDSDIRKELQQQLQDNNDLLSQNQADIDSANADIADMEKEISRLKNGTSDSIDTLQDQISTITSSLTEMDTTQKTLDELLKNLKDTVGNPEEPTSGTIISDLSNTQNTLSLLEERLSTLETKTQNIKPGVQIPFSFGIQDGKYGYYNDNTFVDFKSQSDIEGAVADATGNMTGTAETNLNRYVVTAQGTPKYKTENIKNNFIISLNYSKDPDGNFVFKANGETVNILPKQVEATARDYYGGIRGSLMSSKINGVKRLTLSDYIASSGGYEFLLGSQEKITFPAGYYDKSLSVASGVFSTGKFKATTKSMSIDMGENSFYRYVDTSNIPNNNFGTYTFPYGNGGTVDMGETNSYRYVNAGNVYNKGKSDGSALCYSNSVASSYAASATRSYTLGTGIYMVAVGNGGASGTNHGTNSISVGSGASILGQTATSALSTTDPNYCAWSGLRVALVQVTASSATISLYSEQGNHSTGSCNLIVKIR